MSNAFESVRPRGAAAPSAPVRPHNIGRAPGLLPGSVPRTMTLDRNGKPRVPLAPRSNGSFVIESASLAQESVLKRQAIRRGGI